MVHNKSRHKISLIGAGNIGGMLAYIAAMQELGDIALCDINDGIPQGKALDIAQSAAVSGFESKIAGVTNDYTQITGSDVVIVTAGRRRSPGMSRDDLLEANGGIMAKIGQAINEYASDAFVIVITNPLDVMVQVLQQGGRLATNKVVGMAGVLDTSRFKYFLAEELGVSINDIASFVLGGHGDAMVPMVRYTTISGIPLQIFIDNGWLSQQKLAEIIARTRDGGAEIGRLMQNASAYYAPAASAIAMAKSYLNNERRVLPCAAYLNGEYGYSDIYAGVPVIIGENGVEKIIELPLNEAEKSEFATSVAGVQQLTAAWHKLSDK